ncbi:NAD-dependent epimerase/dehydratase family protein [Gracilibacillus alcaliphilus]|uniref:NAD-dependent epimerase/dehydratase family protein n=1 Tax=Gracilibacillus alcaliphilus TaxID=1401441 RepID=UPI00195BAC1E|nr:NAD(P)-dependent oxidoreductase [Gracilibacillus alcaliphilus]MBM7678449.1 nucleoside-diphosphate-sugar epimerase [Gracilibacillus alcaliphilus]
MNSPKTVIVSGASGFLGKQLVKQMVRKNEYNVVALTSNANKLKSEIGTEENLNIYIINEFLKTIDGLSENDVFINCAFPRSSDPSKLAKGIEFTEEIIQKMIKKGIRNIINISSQSVYSQKTKTNTDETTQVVPESFYGMTKYATERIVAATCELIDFKINYSNIRLASLTGNELEARMTNRFVKNALSNKSIIINGGNQKISYLDVRDAAEALIQMLNVDPNQWNNVYNLGNHYYFTVLELAETVKQQAADLLGREVKLEITEGNDDFNNLINSSQFYNDFNWRPVYDMPSIVTDLFNYYSEKEETV